jgi:hypothetical protein
MAQRAAAASTTKEPFFDFNRNGGIVARVFIFAVRKRRFDAIFD